MIPLSPAASSFADSPSTMKLFDRFRWLAMEMPWPGTADVSAKELGAADVRRRHAGNEQREIEEVAAVHRQALDFGLRYRSRDLASRRFEDGGFAGDGDARSRVPRPPGPPGCRRRSRRVALSVRVLSANPSHVDLHFVGPDLEVRETESSFRVRHGLRRDIRFRLTCADLRSGHDGALRIGDASAHAGEIDRSCALAARADRRQRSTPSRSAHNTLVFMRPLRLVGGSISIGGSEDPPLHAILNGQVGRFL